MTPAKPGEGEFGDENLDGQEFESADEWWQTVPKGGAKPRPTIKKLYDERQALAETKIRPNTSRRPSLGERPEPEREDPGTTRRSNEQEQRTTLEGLRKLQEFAKLNFTKAEAKATTYRDWLEMLTMQLEAVSQTTTDYWDLVCAEVRSLHGQYLALSAAQKPNLEIVSKAALDYKEVERSMRPLLLKALPKYLQDQLLARGEVNVTKCLLEACIEAAPGGQEDKGVVLGMLQFPKTANAPTEALKILRA